jgi:outer membrane protein assembly factor BamB
MNDVQLSRRRLIASATAAGFAIAGAGTYFGRTGTNSAHAQDEVAAEATPISLGPAIPDEFNTETNWPYENLDLSATRNVRGSTISTSTIGTLGDVWNFPVTAGAAFGALTANPTIVDGVIYLQDAAANIYALQADTGEQIWANMYNDVVPSGGPNGTANAYGMVFSTIGGVGDVIALEAATGTEIWRTNIQGPLREGITTAPLVYNSIVYVSTIPGHSEGFYAGGQRGLIHALDAATGTVIWYLDTTTENLWGNPTVNSGGGFWHPPSVDEEGKIYVGIGNAAPYPGAEGWPFASSRPGDNDYANNILKIDPSTAVMDWHVNINPADPWDLDNQLTPILAEVDGRKVVFTSGKHGYVVSLDRATGEQVWRTAVGTHKNDDRRDFPDPNESIEVWPGTLGGVETPMAFDAATNLVLAPVYELPSTYIGTGFDPNKPFDFTSATGFIVALNATDGSIAWQTATATGPLAGLTVINDVLISGGLDGVVFAYNIADGSEVWKYQLPVGINAPIAVSGDWVFLPAGGPLIPTAASNPTLPAGGIALYALNLTGTVQAPWTAGEAATPEASPVDAGASETALTAVDIAFQPNALTIPAGQDVAIAFTNEVQLQHDFTCDDLGVKSELLDAGGSTTVTINAAAGTYEFYCSVPGHKDAGMIGTLTVQ